MDSSQDGMVTLRGTDQVLGELDSSRTADSLAEVTNITNDESASVYELRVEDRTVAGLVGGVLDKLRTEGRTVTLTCPFATAFVHSHPEYADVVDPTFPGNAHSRRHGRRH